MKWHNCKDEPPAAGVYEILMLCCTGDGRKMWFQTSGIYNSRNDIWTIKITENTWSSDAGTPLYWIKLPPLPPVPYDGPMCKYYSDGLCVGQKNSPRCYCQGNTEECEK